MRAHFGPLAFSTSRIVIISAAVALVAAIASTMPARGAEVEVMTGDTFRIETATWRIANIDAPRVEGTCDAEARLGVLAQAKLAEVLGTGEMEIAPTGGVDRFEHKTALVRMNGQDVGEKMIAAGLAQRHGQARALCPRRNIRDLRNDSSHLPPGSTPMSPQAPMHPHMN